MIANHTERRTSSARIWIFLVQPNILADAIGGGSVPHLGAYEEETLER
jgi:hypothetical protein